MTYNYNKRNLILHHFNVTPISVKVEIIFSRIILLPLHKNPTFIYNFPFNLRSKISVFESDRLFNLNFRILNKVNSIVYVKPVNKIILFRSLNTVVTDV